MAEACSSLPDWPNIEFFGRNEYIDWLRDCMNETCVVRSRDGPKQVQKFKIFGLFGTKGVGKSSVVKEFIKRLEEADNEGLLRVLYFDFSELKRFQSFLDKFCDNFGIPRHEWQTNIRNDTGEEDEEDFSHFTGNVEKILRQNRNRKFLIFLDNVEHICAKAKKDGSAPDQLKATPWDKINKYFLKPILSRFQNMLLLITATQTAKYLSNGMGNCFCGRDVEEMSKEEATGLMEMLTREIHVDEKAMASIVLLCDGLPSSITRAATRLKEGEFSPVELFWILFRDKIETLSDEFLPADDRTNVCLHNFLSRLTNEDLDNLMEFAEMIPRNGAVDIKKAADNLSTSDSNYTTETEKVALFKRRVLLVLKNKGMLKVNGGTVRMNPLLQEFVKRTVSGNEASGNSRAKSNGDKSETCVHNQAHSVQERYLWDSSNGTAHSEIPTRDNDNIRISRNNALTDHPAPNQVTSKHAVEFSTTNDPFCLENNGNMVGLKVGDACEMLHLVPSDEGRQTKNEDNEALMPNFPVLLSQENESQSSLQSINEEPYHVTDSFSCSRSVSVQYNAMSYPHYGGSYGASSSHKKNEEPFSFESETFVKHGMPPASAKSSVDSDKLFGSGKFDTSNITVDNPMTRCALVDISETKDAGAEKFKQESLTAKGNFDTEIRREITTSSRNESDWKQANDVSLYPSRNRRHQNEKTGALLGFSSQCSIDNNYLETNEEKGLDLTEASELKHVDTYRNIDVNPTLEEKRRGEKQGDSHNAPKNVDDETPSSSSNLSSGNNLVLDSHSDTHRDNGMSVISRICRYLNESWLAYLE